MATLPRSLVQRRANSLDTERETFEKNQAVSIQKAINTVEGSVKEKHVRFILIGTHQERGIFDVFDYKSFMYLFFCYDLYVCDCI